MSAVEWVREDDWSKVKVGQRVRLEHENGDVAELTPDAVAFSGAWFSTPNNTFGKSDGWTLYVTSPPTPELPTEPGTVITWKNGAYLDAIAQKCPEGRLGWWAYFGQGGRWHTDAELLAVIEETEHTPLTRLAPVPDTARQVLDRLSEMKNEYPNQTLAEGLLRIRAEFGVTEP